MTAPTCHCGHELVTAEARACGACINCAQAELARLRAALPKTADGVTMYPGMPVWGSFLDGVYRGRALQFGDFDKIDRALVWFDAPGVPLWEGSKDLVQDLNPSCASLYSTEAAARAAQ